MLETHVLGRDKVAQCTRRFAMYATAHTAQARPPTEAWYCTGTGFMLTAMEGGQKQQLRPHVRGRGPHTPYRMRSCS